MVQDLEKAAGGNAYVPAGDAREQVLFNVADPQRSGRNSRRPQRKTGQPGEQPADRKRTRIIPPKPRHGF
jgi:hypothetical protein